MKLVLCRITNAESGRDESLKYGGKQRKVMKPEELTETVLKIPSNLRKGSNLFFLHVHVLPRMCISTSIRAWSVLLKVLNKLCAVLWQRLLVVVETNVGMKFVRIKYKCL